MSLVKLIQVSFGAMILCGVTYAQTPNGSTIVGTPGFDYSQTNSAVDRGITPAPSAAPTASGSNIQVIDGLVLLSNTRGAPDFQAGQLSPGQATPQPQPPQTQVQMPASTLPTPTVRLPSMPAMVTPIQ